MLTLSNPFLLWSLLQLRVDSRKPFSIRDDPCASVSSVSVFWWFGLILVWHLLSSTEHLPEGRIHVTKLVCHFSFERTFLLFK